MTIHETELILQEEIAQTEPTLQSQDQKVIPISPIQPFKTEAMKSYENPHEILREKARAFMGELGFFYDGEFPETEGSQIEKFAGENNHKGKRSWLKTSYFDDKDGIPGMCITFGRHDGLEANERTTKTFWMQNSSWQGLSIEEKNSIRKQREHQQLQAKEKAKHDKTIADELADKALNRFATAKQQPPKDAKTYFSKKGLGVFSDIHTLHWECVTDYTNGQPEEKWVAIVGLRDGKGQIRAIQELWPDKKPWNGGEEHRDKNYIGKTSGCFATIGKLENNGTVFVTEGFATALSIFQVMCTTTVAAMSCGNLSTVVKELRKRYPEQEIIICADNDHHQVNNTNVKGNPGLEAARKAAIEYGCKLAVPEFPEGEWFDSTGKARTDFDDIRQLNGLNIVKKQVEQAKMVDINEIDDVRNTNLDIKHQRKDAKTQSIKRIPTDSLNVRPTIRIIPGELHVITSAAEEALIKNSTGIYQRGGQLTKIVKERSIAKPKKDSNQIKRNADALVITSVDHIHLSECMGMAINWERYDARTGDWKMVDTPEKVAKTLIARSQWEFPYLSGIIQAPTLRPDGSILDHPGYDEETGLFFDPGSTYFNKIPLSPSREEAIVAMDTLLSLLAGFPFENEESKSVGISAILTGLIRRSIRTAPLHGYSAPKMGSGKSLLADIVGLISTGKPNSVIPQANDEAEEKKRLLTVLMEGDPIVCYDNIERPFCSSAICSVLTQESYKDRLLGASKNISVPTNALFLATGNNLTFAGDISTRAILCRLDPQCERPEEREFKVDLRKHIPEYRGKFVQAALTILRAYHVAGRPKQPIKQFGRFEEWSDWVRSAIVWVGLEDPCTTRKEIENADPIRATLGNLLEAWFAVFDDHSMKTKDVVKKVMRVADECDEKLELLRDALRDIAPDHSNGISERSLGKKLSSFKGRIENGLRLEVIGGAQGTNTWRVKRVEHQ